MKNILIQRPFASALVISFFAHGVILASHPDFHFLPQKNPEELEIKYVQETKKKDRADQYKQEKKLKVEPLLNLQAKISAKVAPPPPFVDKQEVYSAQVKKIALGGVGLAKPVLSRPDIISVKKKITLPPLPLGTEKSNNPSYISYYQIVREKIKRCAYQNYTRTEMGEVYLTFVITNQGYVSQERMVPEKSVPSRYLQETALRSVRDASPFPAFPKELDYPQLTFNVVVSFEVE